MERHHVDVAVVGAGPVGMYLAAELAHRGVDVLVLERTLAPIHHSRSIGIHPPALEALAGVGAAARILRHAVRVRSGAAMSGGEMLGTLSFGTLPTSFPFVATLPQDRTEAILVDVLEAIAPKRVLRGREVRSVSMVGDGVDVAGVARDVEDATERPFAVRAAAVVACDGRESAVRAALGLRWQRRSYPDAYAMGDVQDATDLGNVAAIYLERDGVVESFPLPHGRRRWVVKTAGRMPHVTAEGLAQLVAERVGVSIDAATCTMTSTFGIERAVAERFAKGRILLAGDSAHVVPPIGGQGMNLGWLDAHDLAGWLPDALQAGSRVPWEAAADAYDARRRRAFRMAARRAELNVRLGRATRWSWTRRLVVRALLSSSVAPTMARMFTMQGLSTAAPSEASAGRSWTA